MAYFPNGTAGDLFRGRNCYGCVNWKDAGDGRGYGCPVYDAHLLFPWHDPDERDENGHAVPSAYSEVLDVLIPRPEKPSQVPTCSMFHPDDSEDALERLGQLSMLGRD